jgi:hypothetical protein
MDAKTTRPAAGRRSRSASRAPATPDPAAAPAPPEKHLVLTADEDITIRCGQSSITLTAAGKIIIRGKYIVSRSSGVQRIKGGSVQIN